jgi:homoserine dehydrogenase
VTEETSRKIIVLKFGSSVVRTAEDLPNAVHEIYRWVRAGYRAIAVVSAIGGTTDRLLTEARALTPAPEAFSIAELLATGERSSAALLGIALDRAGLPARVLNPREIGLTVAGSPLDSELVSANVERLRTLLVEYSVLVVPGFFGTDATGRTHLLGRGGSDLSAVFLAQALGARARLIKDVDGVFESDPASSTTALPRRFTSLEYSDALRVAGPLIQPKAVSFLRAHGTCAEVAALARDYASVVHSGSTQLAERVGAQPPLGVLLLGLGTVGFGVYQRLQANSEQFEIVGCLVRDRAKYEHLNVAPGLLHTNPSELMDVRADIVVDALPDVEPSRMLLEHHLRRGSHAVSASKALIAECGSTLAAFAKEGGGSLRYSAAVGGSTLMIETVDRATTYGAIGSIAAVLNGTCNVVLDACAAGRTLVEAIADAQAQGFAEADPTDDLSGRDAARKLQILSRHAWNMDPNHIDVQILNESIAHRAREAARVGQRLRQISRAKREPDGVRAHVTFEVVDARSHFGELSREWNAIELMDGAGRTQHVTGRGAGRWPTAEAVMADMFEVTRDPRAPWTSLEGPSRQWAHCRCDAT